MYFFWSGQWFHNCTTGQLDKLFLESCLSKQSVFPQRGDFQLMGMSAMPWGGLGCFSRTGLLMALVSGSISPLSRRIGRNQERTSGGIEGNQGRKLVEKGI